MNLVPTSEQSAVTSHVKENRGHLHVQAFAGSAKTTTLVMAANQTNMMEPCLALAFNKRIQVDLEKKLPPNVVCKTINGLGHQLWGQALGKRLKLEADKLFQICREIDPKEPYELKLLASAAKTLGFVPLGMTHGQPVGTDWREVFLFADMTFNRGLVPLISEVLTRNIKLAYEGVVDFDDQIYMPAVFGFPVTQWGTIFVDEAQDMSLLNIKLLTRLRPKRIVTVGDAFQSIYGFRGADTEAMGQLQKAFPGDALTLSTCFRCSKEVVRQAQIYAKGIRPWDEAKLGQVKSESTPAGLLSYPDGCVVLCRNNAPLVKLAYKLLRRGVSCTFLGRDLAKGLVKLINKIGKGVSNKPEFLLALANWKRDELEGADTDLEKAMIEDKVDTIEAIVEATSGNKVADIVATLESLFSREKGSVTLSTGHKAKGLEWEHVYILDRELCPSKWARQAQTKWEEEKNVGFCPTMQQERNLLYVMITRSKNTLTYIRSN